MGVMQIFAVIVVMALLIVIFKEYAILLYVILFALFILYWVIRFIADIFWWIVDKKEK